MSAEDFSYSCFSFFQKGKKVFLLKKNIMFTRPPRKVLAASIVVALLGIGGSPQTASAEMSFPKLGSGFRVNSSYVMEESQFRETFNNVAIAPVAWDSSTESEAGGTTYTRMYQAVGLDGNLYYIYDYGSSEVGNANSLSAGRFQTTDGERYGHKVVRVGKVGDQTIDEDGNQHIEGDSTIDGDSNIGGDQTVNNDQTVKGDQIINGDSTVANQTIEGNQIINKYQTVGSGADGDGQKVDGNQEVTGDQHVGGNQEIDKDQTIHGNQGVEGNSTINGNQTVHGHQWVQDGQSVTGDQSVDGNQTVTGDQDVQGDGHYGGNLDVDKDLNVDGALDVDGNSHTHGNSYTDGNSTVGGDQYVAGNETIHGDQRVEGNSSILGSQEIGKDQTVHGNQTVDGDLLVKGDSSTLGSHEIGKDLITHGNFTTDGNSLVKGDSTTLGSEHIGKDLIVDGTSYLHDTNVDGDLDVIGGAHVGGNATVDKDLTVHGNGYVDGGLGVKGDEAVGGSLVVGKDFAVSGNSYTGGDQYVGGNSHIAGNQVIDGTLTASDVFLGNGLSVTNELARQGTEIGEVAAGAAALAGLDYMPYEDGQKLSFAVGFGSYKSHQATALGAKYYFNKDVALNLASTLGYNENMISGGLSFRFGPGGSKRIASPEVTQKLAEMEGEISALKAQNAKLMEALDQLMKEHEAQENTQDAVM